MPTLPLIAMFVITTVAFLIVRIGSIALMMTGLPRETASFQALSAFFGVGFTTTEAELVVSNHVRRQIVKHLIILGNLGITSGLATFIVTILSNHDDNTLSGVELLGIVVGGVVALFAFFNVGPVRKVVDWAISKSLLRAGVIRPIDYEVMLRATDGYAIGEMRLAEGSEYADRTLREAALGARGVLVLGISRADATYVGTPGADDRLKIGDQLLVYGREDDLHAVGAGTQAPG